MGVSDLDTQPREKQFNDSTDDNSGDTFSDASDGYDDDSITATRMKTLVSVLVTEVGVILVEAIGKLPFLSTGKGRILAASIRGTCCTPTGTPTRHEQR